MKVRIGVIAVLLIAVVGFASSASACEKCVSAGYNGWTKCESGHASGKLSCYGGFGATCTADGVCGSGGDLDDPGPFYRDWSVQPCLTCTGAEPAQGFVLRSEAAQTEALAEGSLQRSELTQ